MTSPLRIGLRYGREVIELGINATNFLGFIAPRAPSTVGDLQEAIDHALNHPFESPSLDDFLETGDTVAITVSDLTRYTGAQVFLPRIINHMNQRGIEDEDVSLVFALGIHRPLSSGEQATIVGKELADRIPMENHDPANSDGLVYLGKTTRGTPVAINRRVTEARKVILTGTIGFHYLAGFGGGRKSILPGVASYEGCIATHLLVLNPEGKGRHPKARTGVLDGNPMHEDMMEAARLLPPKFLFNTVLSADREILHVAAGNWETAFYQGCQFLDQHFKVRVLALADLVIVSCGGFPKDINFIQAHKTFDYAMNALKPGGAMILVAACPEGLGHNDFTQWLRFGDLGELESELRKKFQINGQTAYATLLKAKSVTVILLSELPESVVKAMYMTPVQNLEEGLMKAYQVVGDNPSTYVIPYGAITLPWCDCSP